MILSLHHDGDNQITVAYWHKNQPFRQEVLTLEKGESTKKIASKVDNLINDAVDNIVFNELDTLKSGLDSRAARNFLARQIIRNVALARKIQFTLVNTSLAIGMAERDFGKDEASRRFSLADMLAYYITPKN